MSTPFKMKGFGGFKSSPAKQAGRWPTGIVAAPGGRTYSDPKWGNLLDAGVTFSPGKSPTSIMSITTPKVASINLGRDKKTTIGGKISVKDAVTFNAPNTQMSLTGKTKFGGGTGPRGLHAGFRGSLSGEVGVRDAMSKRPGKEKGKIAGSAKLSLGGGTKSYNIGGFAEHSTSKHLKGGGTRVGIEGKAGIFKGSVGYNIKTKKPEFKIGINL
jgi:hypothetical protein